MQAIASSLLRLTELVDQNRQPTDSKSKPREPETFDGSDPEKLQQFLVLLKLNFESRPRAFSDDARRVNYALSYLRGSALEWFEPDILGPARNAPWLTNFDEFEADLRANFGPFDPVSDAEDRLDNIIMKDNQRIVKYVVAFNRLAGHIGYDDAALRRRFYHGLPGRIKTRVTDLGKPDTLAGLRTMAQTIDARHWEREAEISREQNRSGKERSTDKSSGGNARSKSSNNNSGAVSTSNSVPSNPPKSTAAPNPLIGKDGKLLPAERQRRVDQNLCLFCGSPDHRVSDCPRSAAKGRAATTGTRPAATAPDAAA
jgi:hypothetical protein